MSIYSIIIIIAFVGFGLSIIISITFASVAWCRRRRAQRSQRALAAQRWQRQVTLLQRRGYYFDEETQLYHYVDGHTHTIDEHHRQFVPSQTPGARPPSIVLSATVLAQNDDPVQPSPTAGDTVNTANHRAANTTNNNRSSRGRAHIHYPEAVPVFNTVVRSTRPSSAHHPDHQNDDDGAVAGAPLVEVDYGQAQYVSREPFTEEETAPPQQQQ
ncbi:hypothetical protein STCU_10560 [Strigomonas culicis]|uniref:Uncharacterized protein n=1 Tax=Strigomonas culicis TaxID=28005 RepID=S9TMG8_9TRYP|nr:hypothetical protein STCU_10560 [Strigomonas culicis]|eukprot:EPY17528.1 hypothetical protein STCU_10560 [Strigomonas culicis]